MSRSPFGTQIIPSSVSPAPRPPLEDASWKTWTCFCSEEAAPANNKQLICQHTSDALRTKKKPRWKRTEFTHVCCNRLLSNDTDECTQTYWCVQMATQQNVSNSRVAEFKPAPVSITQAAYRRNQPFSCAYPSASRNEIFLCVHFWRCETKLKNNASYAMSFTAWHIHMLTSNHIRYAYYVSRQHRDRTILSARRNWPWNLWHANHQSAGVPRKGSSKIGDCSRFMLALIREYR